VREPLIWEEYFSQVDLDAPDFVEEGVPSSVGVGETRTTEGEPTPRDRAVGTDYKRR
jgi:hypothetical protein